MPSPTLEPILTRAETNMVTLIQGMSPTTGYYYTWTTVNQEDLAKGELSSTIARAAIYLEPDETNVDDVDGAHAGAYTNVVRFRIRSNAKLATESSNPVFDANKVLNKMLHDLKRLFGSGIGASLNDVVSIIRYERSERILHQITNDIFIPKSLDTYWAVEYMQDRQEPTIIDP